VPNNNSSEPVRKFSAPGRTELAGNHTDHNHGKVLAASINLEVTADVQKTNDNTVFFRSAGFPDVMVKLTDSNGNFDLQPKHEETGTTEALIRGIAAEMQKRGRKVGGFSANAVNKVIAGSGLSSSAALEILIAFIFDSLYCDSHRNEEKINSANLSALDYAQIGQIAENVYFGKPCGLMDQIACAAGGAVAIDFKDEKNPVVTKINFDPSCAGYSLCVVNTGGSHADLTADYAAIPNEMKAVASFFGKSVLRELDKETVLSRAAEIRKQHGDRSILRALHFFDENERVDAMTEALQKTDSANSSAAKKEAFNRYLDLVNESGDSSWKLLQNVYSPTSPENQGITTALSLTKEFLQKQKLRAIHPGACRVHGGGFAGTIQVYIPAESMDKYRACMEAVFGANCVTQLDIRPHGAIELV